MSKSALEVLECDEQVEKRAQWEAFEFTVLGDGDVEVVNGSHSDADDHTYTVHVVGDIPADCRCPAWEFQPGACKHMVAVAIQEPVLEAVTDALTARTDGGTAVNVATETDTDDCDCGELSGDFPCWPCVRNGRRDLPGADE